ncbi:Phage integrase family protein [uncultured archaeon]|nr:Phage integrase family protein [uncultured archaeon]
MKIDPYNHEGKYKTWKEKSKKNGIEGVSKENSDLILKYVEDMELGLNISLENVKGGRSFIRLNTLREKMIFLAKKFEDLYGLKIMTEINEEQLVSFFSKMSRGDIKKRDGGIYLSTVYFIKVFKAFWHWYQLINRKQKIEVLDITPNLDTRSEKPKWVYLTEEQVKLLCDNAKPKYKVLMMFLFDTGIRSPTELVNIKVSDFYNDFKEVMIKEEISKTFGRKIKLMLCSELIKDYVKQENLSKEDYIFSIKPQTVNKYLQRLAIKILGDKESLAGEKYSEITMYDFRHISCCYWLIRYKSESALKYRFGWKKSDKIHYYSELLGMRDTISEEDMFVDVTKTELEQRLTKTERENEILKERIGTIEERLAGIIEKVRDIL